MSSITHVVDNETREILNRYEYDAWGNLKTCEEKVLNRFRFNGQQYDSVTQQYYLRVRYYNPVIARFTQEDTYRGDGLNLYAYCANNPVYYVDPSGYFCEKAAEQICKLIDEGRIKGKNCSKLYAYLTEQQRNGKIKPWERKVAVKLGINIRLIPGTPGIVTGVYSDIFVIKQCLDAMDISKSIPELEKEVYELQQAARRMIEAGIPIYKCDHVPNKTTKIGKKVKKYMVLVVVVGQNSF